MKLNREQIIEALECHANGCKCSQCPMPKRTKEGYSCWTELSQATLALIKDITEESQMWQEAYDCADSACRELSSKCDELTEENEKLHKRLGREARCQYDLCGQIVNLSDEVKYIKADTVQKMQEGLRAETITIQDHTGKLGSVILVSAVDQIAKEMLEENNV